MPEEKESLSSTIALRVTPRKKEELQGQAQSRGLTLSDFLFQAIEAGMESVKPKAESQAPEEAVRRPDSQPETEREEEGTHQVEVGEETSTSPPESEPSGSPTSEPTGEKPQAPVDEEFLRDLKKRYPELDFDSTMKELDQALTRHPEIKRSRRVVEKYFWKRRGS